MCMPRCNVPVMVVAEWDITATMLDGSDLHGMMPTLFAENPSAAEVAFHGDPVNARKDVDRLNRCLFQAEAVDGEEAIQICRKPSKPRAGDAVYVFRQANIDALQTSVPMISSGSAPEPVASGSGSQPAPTPSGSGSQPPQKKARLETTSDQGMGLCSQNFLSPEII
jgi:hypothetical protein